MNSAAITTDVRLSRLAGVETVLGQLQRGRGEAFLALLEMSGNEAVELVWQCIVHDPRWDLQVESRAVYYAKLAREHGLDIGRLAPRSCPVPVEDVDQRLVIEVLAVLAAGGSNDAAQVLLDHVAAGANWDDAIFEISRLPGEWWRELPAILDGRFDNEECTAIVRRSRQDIPWEQLALDHGWVASGIDFFGKDGSVSESPDARPPSMDSPIEDLLAHEWSYTIPKRLLHRLTTMIRPGEREILVAAVEKSSTNYVVAFRALSGLDGPIGLAAAERILREDKSGRRRAEAIRYVRTLSSEHTLELARRWIAEPDGRANAAQGVFERHAEKSDLPVLRGAFAEAWLSRDFYTLCSHVDSLARLADPESWEKIATIYEESEYSYARHRAALALVSIDQPRFVQLYARAALWDCEEGIQELAADLVDCQGDTFAREQRTLILQGRI